MIFTNALLKPTQSYGDGVVERRSAFKDAAISFPGYVSSGVGMGSNPICSHLLTYAEADLSL